MEGSGFSFRVWVLELLCLGFSSAGPGFAELGASGLKRLQQFGSLSATLNPKSWLGCQAKAL